MRRRRLTAPSATHTGELCASNDGRRRQKHLGTGVAPRAERCRNNAQSKHVLAAMPPSQPHTAGRLRLYGTTVLRYYVSHLGSDVGNARPLNSPTPVPLLLIRARPSDKPLNAHNYNTPFRTHALHVIELTGAPLDGSEEAEEGGGHEAEEGGDEEDGEEDEEEGSSAAGRNHRADVRLFHAGGTCLHRVVLYYALTHFQRRLEAGLRRKVKQALQRRGCW